MKYAKSKTPKRTAALFLALNWFLTDQYDIAHIQEYLAAAGEGPHYTQDEVEASLAKQYVGRFRTRRLRKKRADDLYWLQRSKTIDWSRFKN